MTPAEGAAQRGTRPSGAAEDPLTESPSTVSELLQRSRALAVLHHGARDFVLSDDVREIRLAISDPPDIGDREPSSSPALFAPSDDVEEPAIWFKSGGSLVPPVPGAAARSWHGPAVRSLLRVAATQRYDQAVSNETGIAGWRLRNASAQLHHHATELALTGEEWERHAERDFANTAPYLGTKRALLPFILLAVEDLAPPNVTMLDLMCGSGAVAGALSRRWPTIASDAQAFCGLLALVQGGGYSEQRAVDVAAQLQSYYEANLMWLQGEVAEALREEDEILRSTSDWPSVARHYQRFVRDFPTYPIAGRSGKWDPLAEVAARQAEFAGISPACLFTAYFSNVYFGVRQATEIDSLRHAISELSDPIDRSWALGALIVATHAVSTSYGGHFAQPYAPAERLADAGLLGRVVRLRNRSPLREFQARLRALSRASEAPVHRVETVPGPWRHALDEVARRVDPEGIVVYLDPPYRREEYSRYYHVLETLVTYTYPSASADAKVPTKRVERFASEFHTRSADRMREALGGVLADVLGRGFRCAWSYADGAAVPALSVLNDLGPLVGRVRTVAADHVHAAQGRSARRRDVVEYLLYLEPA